MEIQKIGDITYTCGVVALSRGKMQVYAFATDGIMIDTGSQSLLQHFIPFFEKTDFEKVVLTHHHEDHTGGAAWIQANKRVPIYIHSMSIDDCSVTGDYPDYRKQIWGVREGFQALPLEKSFESKHDKWLTIHTPGHADDHMAFLNQDKGILFSGDLFVSPKTKVILRNESIPITIRSIKSLLNYNFQEVFCSHSGYLSNGKQMLQSKLDYLVNLEGEILHLNQSGKTVQEIKEKLFPTHYPIIQFSNHEWDSEHIITSILNC